jgi:asparagine synthetase B (glutamine-hydrolysing)
LGHRFQSSESDTEVILAAYARVGRGDCLPRFNGMWAFAIWDSREAQTLFLARDRFRHEAALLRPAGRRDGFAFASEMEGAVCRSCPTRGPAGSLGAPLSLSPVAIQLSPRRGPIACLDGGHPAACCAGHSGTVRDSRRCSRCAAGGTRWTT